MEIKCFYPKLHGGTVLYRIKMPHEILDYDVTFTESGSADDLSGDIMVVSKSNFLSVIKSVPQLRQNGTKCIIDFDDYWVLPQDHILYPLYKKNGTTDILVNGLRSFDYVIATTEVLANEIRKINPNVVVLENAVNPMLAQFRPQLEPSDIVRFSWIGGHCHLPDIKLMEDVPERLAATESDWCINLFGHDGNKGSVFDSFAMILSSNGKTRDRLNVYRAASAETYTQFYNLTDVCLIPLRDDKFNSMKSELKLIEAAFFKKPAIVSNVMPYKKWLTDKNCLKVDNKNDWVKHMKRLIRNPALREDLGNQLHADLADKFNVWNVNKRRVEFYESITK